MSEAAAVPIVESEGGGRRHARDLSLTWRVAAYVAMLLGYLLYCYNFLLLDYVRPYLISSYGMTLNGTAGLSVTQNVFITVGSLLTAPILARVGLRKALAGAALAIGILAAAAAQMHTLAGWFGVRAAMALFLGAYYVASVNLTVALFPPRHRAKLAAVNSAMFSLGEVALGGLGFVLGDSHWLWIVWLGALPLALSPVILLLTPEDKTFVAFGAEADHATSSGGWREMLSPRWSRLTLTCMLLAGLNFTGYQLFSSFVTLYLRHGRLDRRWLPAGRISLGPCRRPVRPPG
jgi:MFS family permease